MASSRYKSTCINHMIKLLSVCLCKQLDLLVSNFLAYYSVLYLFCFVFFLNKDEWNIRPEIKSHRVKQKCQKKILLVMKGKLFA